MGARSEIPTHPGLRREFWSPAALNAGAAATWPANGAHLGHCQWVPRALLTVDPGQPLLTGQSPVTDSGSRAPLTGQLVTADRHVTQPPGPTVSLGALLGALHWVHVAISFQIFFEIKNNSRNSEN